MEKGDISQELVFGSHTVTMLSFARNSSRSAKLWGQFVLSQRIRVGFIANPILFVALNGAERVIVANA